MLLYFMNFVKINEKYNDDNIVKYIRIYTYNI